jgi:hypothetical protein
MRILFRLLGAIAAAIAATTHHGYIRQHGDRIDDPTGGER